VEIFLGVGTAICVSYILAKRRANITKARKDEITKEDLFFPILCRSFAFSFFRAFVMKNQTSGFSVIC